MNVICSNVSKKYNDKIVLNNINVKFETGINLLIGANGAGKSTLLNILATIKLLQVVILFMKIILFTQKVIKVSWGIYHRILAYMKILLEMNF